MRKYTRIIAAVLAVLISAGATGMYAVAKSSDTKEDNKTAVTYTAKDKKAD